MMAGLDRVRNRTFDALGVLKSTFQVCENAQCEAVFSPPCPPLRVVSCLTWSIGSALHDSSHGRLLVIVASAC